jgi:hypothetical protein
MYGRVKFFWYKSQKTGKMYSDQRMEGYEHIPLKKAGEVCDFMPDYQPPQMKDDKHRTIIINKNREVFQADSDYVKKCKPKYVKFQDGHRERYDPTKHC